MSYNSHDFLEFALKRGVLQFGEFRTKAGRMSPYFFNFGLFNTGNDLTLLGSFYADAIISSGVKFDVLFGPAYKGIPIAVATAIALARKNINVPIVFNRKEVKGHGEKGSLVGGNLLRRVLVLDDVISAGTSITESQATIKSNGSELAGVCVALDRMERGDGNLSAIQEVEKKFGTRVTSITNLDNLITFLSTKTEYVHQVEKLQLYKSKYRPY